VETHPARNRRRWVAHGQEAEGARKDTHLEFLPSHSPKLQPSERLWPLSNEGVANRHIERIEDLEEALVGVA
jgi:transposase